MENMMTSDNGDTANIETLLNSAVWFTGALIVPTCSSSNDDANDESLEVVR